MQIIKNHFETAVIIHRGGIAYDSGVCTFHDDDHVTVEFPTDGEFSVASRYGDSRENDDLPAGLRFVSAEEFMRAYPTVRITATA